MGWQRNPAGEEVAGWPAGGQALPGAGAVWQMYSVGMVEGVGDRGRGVSGGVMGAVWRGKGSDQGGVGGV